MRQTSIPNLPDYNHIQRSQLHCRRPGIQLRILHPDTINKTSIARTRRQDQETKPDNSFYIGTIDLNDSRLFEVKWPGIGYFDNRAITGMAKRNQQALR